MKTKTEEIEALNDLFRTGANPDLGLSFTTSGIRSGAPKCRQRASCRLRTPGERRAGFCGCIRRKRQILWANRARKADGRANGIVQNPAI